MPTERYALEMPGELAESRILARASFLSAILILRPHVLKDLWLMVFPAFRNAVSLRFHSQITNDMDLHNYHKEKEAQFFEDPSSCGDYAVALIQRKLLLRQAEGQDSLRHEFFGFHSLTVSSLVQTKTNMESYSRLQLQRECVLKNI